MIKEASRQVPSLIFEGMTSISAVIKGGKREIASYAACVFEAADKGDLAAKKIIAHNACCIARLIESAGKKTDSHTVEAVIVGGLTARADLLLPLINDGLNDRSRYNISMSTSAPVKGAILLAGGKYNA